MIERARKRLSKRAKKGFRGWPVATVALYGPDDSTATKLTVGIMPAEDAEATDLRRWFSKEQTDIRDDIRVARRRRLSGLPSSGRDGTAGPANDLVDLARSPSRRRMAAICAKLPLTTYIADRDGSTETESHPRRSDRMLRGALDG